MKLKGEERGKKEMIMKTIKERAAEYAHKYRREVRDLSGERTDAAFAGFIAGAKSEREELLRWRDPEKELPETDVEVLVKIDAPHNKYDIMKHNQHGWWQKAPGGGWCAPKYKPIGWRHIHEL